VVTFLTDRKRNGQAISRWRQRASSIGRVGARRVLEAVEVEDEIARLLETSIGVARVEKTASAICRRPTGGIAKNEKQFCPGGIFENWLEAIGLARNRELR
jgi:hypothetical protein